MTKPRKIDETLSVSPQIAPADLSELRAAGYRSVICNRPDGEGTDQHEFEEIEAAAREAGLEAYYLPVQTGRVTADEAQAFGEALRDLPGPTLAYCRSGMRSATLWSLAVASRVSVPEILETTAAAGYDMSGVVRRIAAGGRTPTEHPDAHHEVVIVGGGAAGISAAASLKARRPGLDIAIIDPSDVHYYQPGWTLVGGGVFKPEDTARTMGSLIPQGVHWIKAAVAAFEPKDKAVILDGCRVVQYDRLVVCPGLKLDWQQVEGLPETLGRNGVTSNYRYDLAPYTWQLVQGLGSGRALFTQPPMPIKCAGAPQKAMYLSGDQWRRRGVLDAIDIEFHLAGAVLFGVKEYVPALERYIERYGVDVRFRSNLVAVDGPGRRAWFDVTDDEGHVERVERAFDMLHVCPPQTAPDFIRVSPLADDAGWVDVDRATLQHARYPEIWALGDVTNAPNAKTAAAARKQAPVVAENLLADLDGKSPQVQYDGYGSCPLTVERGRVVLAEFGYGGALLPSFPRWLINGRQPSRLAWLLKERLLPPIYWKAMLRGREWLAQPEKVKATQ